MLAKFPDYIKNDAEEHPYFILEGLGKRQHYKSKERPLYSAELIRTGLQNVAARGREVVHIHIHWPHDQL